MKYCVEADSPTKRGLKSTADIISGYLHPVETRSPTKRGLKLQFERDALHQVDG